jgi:hypothetical protein
MFFLTTHSTRHQRKESVIDLVSLSNCIAMKYTYIFNLVFCSHKTVVRKGGYIITCTWRTQNHVTERKLISPVLKNNIFQIILSKNDL